MDTKAQLLGASCLAKAHGPAGPWADPEPLLTPAGVRQRLPVHPGRFLARHYLVPLGLTQTEAAKRLGVSRRRVNELVQGHRAMTPHTAIRCARVFGLPTADWLAMQANWDSHALWKAQRAQPRAA